MSLLEVQGLTVRYGPKTIVENVNFTLERGQWLMLVGPNGAGKSTIVNAISQGAPYTGSVRYEGRDVKRIRPVELARCLGVLSQKHSVGYAFTVGEVVRLGRYAYSPGLFGAQNKAQDADLVDQAMALTGVSHLVDQNVLTLSGGELQRTFLAQLFAQDPKLLILDEPTNHLDLVYQKQIFALIHDWLKAGDRAVISVVHDLSLARANGTHALLLQNGKTLASGPLDTVFTPAHLDAAYSMNVTAWMRQMLSQWT